MGFNWLDFILILALLAGLAIGYAQGAIRQAIGLAALYVGLVLATQFFQGVSRIFGNLLHTPPNTLSNAIVFFVILFAVAALVNFLAIDAYKATKIKLIPLLDHVVGMGLGLLSMWVIVTIVVTVLLFATNTQSWTGGAEVYRLIIANGLANSRVSGITTSTLPMIVSSIRPWLPSGMPAIFSL